MKKQLNDDGGDPNPDSDPRPGGTVIGEGEIRSIIDYSAYEVIFYKNKDDYNAGRESWRRKFKQRILPPFPCNGGVIILTKSNKMFRISNEGITI